MSLMISRQAGYPAATGMILHGGRSAHCGPVLLQSAHWPLPREPMNLTAAAAILRTLCLMSFCVLAGCHRADPVVHANALDISWRFATTLADFQLVDTSGRARSLAEFRDKVVMLTFGYTHCPEACPT